MKKIKVLGYIGLGAIYPEEESLTWAVRPLDVEEEKLYGGKQCAYSAKGGRLVKKLTKEQVIIGHYS